MSEQSSETGGRGEVVRALLLWVLVVVGLAYGVISTVLNVPALFGG